MRKYILFLFLSFFFLANTNKTSAQTGVGCGFVSIIVDGCCVYVQVLPAIGTNTWEVDMGDGTLITSNSEPDNKFEYCYQGNGNFTLILIYRNSSGASICGASVPIEIKNCVPVQDSCAYHTCWDMVADCCQLDTVKSITLNIGGVDTVFPFTVSYHVTGNYQEIVDEILAILNALNWGGTFMSYAPTPWDCHKGNDLIPGFTFFGSSIPIVSINGVKDCGTGGGWVNASVGLDFECD